MTKHDFKTCEICGKDSADKKGYCAECDYMNTPEHTPTELWFKEGHNDGQIYGIDGKTLAIIPNNYPIGYLFAAAPELLEACKLAILDYEYKNEGYAPRPDTPVIKALKEAITKAEAK